MKKIESSAEKLSTSIEKGLGRLRHYFLAGIFCVSFLALFIYIFGIIANTVAGVFFRLGLGTTHSIVLLFGVILIVGLVVNVFGSQKFATSNSFIVIMARSFIKLAEKSKAKDSLKSYKIPLSGLVGVDSIMQLELVKERLRIKELELRKKCPDDWIDHLASSNEFLRYKELLEKIEDKGNESASICIFSGNGAEEIEVDGLWSTTPNLITGFPFFNVSLEKAERVDTKVAVSEVTSGTLGK